jgi:hypothetical protein
MPDNYIEEFFRDLFRAELQRRYALDAATDMPVAALTVLTSVGIYFVSQLTQMSEVSSVVLVGVPLLGLWVSIIGSAIQISRSLWDYQVADLPTPQQLAAYFDSLVKDCGEDADARAKAVARFRAENRADFVVAGEVTAVSNDSRANCLFWARRCLILALLFAGISGVAYAFVPQKPTLEANHGGETVQSTERADVHSAERPNSPQAPSSSPGATTGASDLQGKQTSKQRQEGMK